MASRHGLFNGTEHCFIYNTAIVAVAFFEQVF